MSEMWQLFRFLLISDNLRRFLRDLRTFTKENS